MSDLWIPLLPFALFFAWLLFFATRRVRLCPDCHAPLPAIQSPWTKTKRQWIEGGYVCRNCGCEADVTGKKVPAGTAPRRQSVIAAVVLPALAVIPALILLAIILQR
jgi:hypothetical protein